MSSAAQAVVFWLFALLAVAGAVLTITRRNVVTAVMCLVGTFLSLAVLYAMLSAHFLAVIQVLVYAGAIMVLFVFVVMILNREEDEPWGARGLFGKAIGGLALLYLIGRVALVLWQVPGRLPEASRPALTQVGTTARVGEVLFTSYLFPFEVVSIVLLIAVVGALVIAHPHRHLAGAEGDATPAVKP